ncbi:MAG TPA: ribosome biogenesis GTPase YqeH [Bacillota bacterium]
MESLHCQGCGVLIQTTDPQEAGYTPTSALERENILCKRCFRLKHYNEVTDVSITDDDFLKMVSTIRNAKGLVVHVLDIFDVSGTMIGSLPRISGDRPILLVGNKIDLLPKSTNKRKLKDWLRQSAREVGIRVQDVFLISSTKGYGIEELMEQMDHYRNGRDVYIVGATNVGKSTFINRLIKQSVGMDDVITTSYYPGTTLGFIEIPLDDRTFLYDTPGIVNDQQMVHYVSEHDLKVISPQKEIKPRVYQLHDQQTLFFGGLARLDILKGSKQSIVCYFSNELRIHRTKLANADSFYNRHVGELLSPPDDTTLKTLPSLTKDVFRIKEEKTDIVFPGLGWISVPGENITVAAHSPQGVAVSIRKSLI